MPRQFMVSCDRCSFEREVTSRGDAEAVARQHHDRTSHDIVVLELPRNR